MYPNAVIMMSALGLFVFVSTLYTRNHMHVTFDLVNLLQTLERLRREVADYSPLECLEVPQGRVLMLGQVGSGKSSFFNTINSSFYGYVTGQAPTGSAAHSLTTKVNSIFLST